MVNYLFAVLLGYLLGCSNMALYLSWAKGFDLRETGSGNPGASNAMVSMGWGSGVAVALHDMGKAALAVYLARRFFPAAYAGEIAAAGCVLGHMYPIFFGFRGGKGFASYMGALLMLDWKAALSMMLLCAIVTLVTDYIALATLTAIILTPLHLCFSCGLVPALCMLIPSLAMLWKHRENIRRIREGTEIGLRKANRGEGRVK